MQGITNEKNYQDIADAIRSKLGTDQQFKPSEMAGAIGALAVGRINFMGIYDYNTAEIISEYLNSDILRAEKEAGHRKNTSFLSTFRYYNSLFFPDIDAPLATTCQQMFYGSRIAFTGFILCSNSKSYYQSFSQCKQLRYVALVDTQSCENAVSMFGYSDNIEYIKLTSIAKINNTNEMFSSCNVLKTLEFDQWKQENISVPSSKLTPQSIHYIIQNAMSVAEGATARTLKLHATAKTNWENSEYYQEDLAVLEEKGITIA